MLSVIDFLIAMIAGLVIGYHAGIGIQKVRLIRFLKNRKKSFETWQPPSDAEIFKLSKMNELQFVQDRINDRTI